MAKKNWMAEAFENSHGQFKEAAKANGMSTKAYAQMIMRDKSNRFSTHRKRQANLALQGMKASKKR